ncbi:DNA gyrase subunit A [Babesia ovis]|uniref:DNA gyrase subunit A n=1 Tax=Babesia ovis TaxID=5869 RepID=A0A9W5TEP2_BABOV|nr:DNA gyrase subunit A [Babesia ovis]
MRLTTRAWLRTVVVVWALWRHILAFQVPCGLEPLVVWRHTSQTPVSTRNGSHLALCALGGAKEDSILEGNGSGKGNTAVEGNSTVEDNTQDSNNGTQDTSSTPTNNDTTTATNDVLDTTHTTSSTPNDTGHTKEGSSLEGPDAAQLVQDLELCDELSQSFMKYALSIILGRALPDARDGLKIVHRRILWAMQVMKLNASSQYRKCAKVVGDVLGKYHPHSDKSVYDALCRLSQNFMMRVPLVDGHGNFGSTDDPPAAMRYTECRLTRFSEQLLLGDMDYTVDMLPNFDSTELEPTVLPAKVPMLLINGSSGIAVGLATSIPPHNPGEIIEAAMVMARNQGKVDPERLLDIVRGPDFPTGGHIITTAENLSKIYTTGKGSIMLQAKFLYEERIRVKRDGDVSINTYNSSSQLSFSAGSRISIVVKELPYNVRLRDVMMSISKAVETGALRGIADLRDESDRSGLRLVIDLKKHVTTHLEVEEIMTKLKRMNGLCSFFKCNFIALDSSGTKPVRLSLYSALKIWLDFRVETVRSRTKHLLSQAKERLNIVRGLVIASSHIDEIIRMVRNSTSPTEARNMLCDNRYGGLNQEQAAAVMRMTLSQLSRIEREKFEAEASELTATIRSYNHLLSDDSRIYTLIADELEQIRQNPRKLYTCRRRCTTLSVTGRVKPSGVSTKGLIDVVDHGPTEPLGKDLPPTLEDSTDDDSDIDINTNAVVNDNSLDTVDLSLVSSGGNGRQEPSLIVINNMGWLQRIKLDNSFFTSQRARSIYSSRVYQPSIAQYSITGTSDPAADPGSPQDDLVMKHGLCFSGDTAILIGQDGVCLMFPVSKLRLCSRGYSLWKALKLKSFDKIAYFMLSSRIHYNDASNGTRHSLQLPNSDSYLVVGFSDGDIAITCGSQLLNARTTKSGISRLRLWSNRDEKPVFAFICGPDDDIFVGTSQGYSLRVHVKEFLGGLDNRVKTRRRLIRLKDNDEVTCGALLEAPFSEMDTSVAHGIPPEQGGTSPTSDNGHRPQVDNRHLLLLSHNARAKLLPFGEIQQRRHGCYGYNITRQSGESQDRLAAAVVVSPEDNVLLVSEQGLLARKDPFVVPRALRHHKLRNFWTRPKDDDTLRYAARL